MNHCSCLMRTVYNYMRVNSDTFFYCDERAKKNIVRLFNGVVVNTWDCYEYLRFLSHLAYKIHIDKLPK